jgi:hypothetical protein
MTDAEIVQICSWCLPGKIRVLNMPDSAHFTLNAKGYPVSA